MQIVCDPPPNQWHLPAKSTDRSAWLPTRSAQTGKPIPIPADKPIIATGHQMAIWHPGIFAKYLAVDIAANHHHAQPLHLIVDQDINPALTLDLPIHHDQKLAIHTVNLADQHPNIPTGAHQPVDVSHIVHTLTNLQQQFGDQLTCNLDPLTRAWRDLPSLPTLASQIAAVLARLMTPYLAESPIIHASDLLQTPPAKQLLARMLDDAHRCITCYNQAAKQYPAAGIDPLTITPTQIELPLWLLTPNHPRQRLYADLTSSNPILIQPNGQPIDPTTPHTLAPRALLLTAFMRAHGCDLFIHGRGGGIYDQVTEHWWQQWLGENLAPAAVVSADVHLDFDVPTADRQTLTQAIWYAHHLPHNIDRALNLDSPASKRKRELITTMHDDADRTRRADAFHEIHRINRDLSIDHPHLVEDAHQQRQRAQLGWTNHAIAHKRDWPFALYPETTLKHLADQLAQTP